MTATSPFVLRRDACRISAWWPTEWSETLVADYGARLKELLSERSETFDFVIDASDLERCEIISRGALTDLHQEVLPRLRRTIFIATRAQMRGVCHWIVRVSGDTNARVLANKIGVDSWLSGTLSREKYARVRMKGSGHGG